MGGGGGGGGGGEVVGVGFVSDTPSEVDILGAGAVPGAETQSLPGKHAPAGALAAQVEEVEVEEVVGEVQVEEVVGEVEVEEVVGEVEEVPPPSPPPEASLLSSSSSELNGTMKIMTTTATSNKSKKIDAIFWFLFIYYNSKNLIVFSFYILQTMNHYSGMSIILCF